MATVTRLKAEVNNKNLPILGEDGNLYSYYFGRYFNKIVEKGYTPTPSEKTALEAFIKDGIDNGWIGIVKYFLPLIGDSSHLDAAAVPLIDEVGNYAMVEYDGTEDFSNMFEVNPVNGKIKYYTKVGTTTTYIKSPCTIASMNGGISFYGYIPTPFVDGGSYIDYYASVKETALDRAVLGVRYRETSPLKGHQIMYLADTSASEMTPFTIYYPSTESIENLNAQGKPLIVNYAFYKDNGVVKRLRNYIDADGNNNFVNGNPDNPITYPDYSSSISKLSFCNLAFGGEVPTQRFGCLGILNAPLVTRSLAETLNNAVFTLMTALGK